MENISLSGKANFFESRISSYQRPRVMDVWRGVDDGASTPVDGDDDDGWRGQHDDRVFTTDAYF